MNKSCIAKLQEICKDWVDESKCPFSVRLPEKTTQLLSKIVSDELGICLNVESSDVTWTTYSNPHIDTNYSDFVFLNITLKSSNHMLKIAEREVNVVPGKAILFDPMVVHELICNNSNKLWIGLTLHMPRSSKDTKALKSSSTGLFLNML